jgi:hypothetical protein
MDGSISINIKYDAQPHHVKLISWTVPILSTCFAATILKWAPLKPFYYEKQKTVKTEMVLSFLLK